MSVTRDNKCLDCTSLILKRAKRCRSCAQKHKFSSPEFRAKHLSSITGVPKTRSVRFIENYKQRIGKQVWNSGKTGVQVAWNKGKRMSAAFRAKCSKGQLKRYPWDKPVSPLRKLKRLSVDYKIWQKAVWERDDFTCRRCYVRGGSLHAHHILVFSRYPQHRYDVDNGRTLCKECHTFLHKKYGKAPVGMEYYMRFVVSDYVI